MNIQLQVAASILSYVSGNFEMFPKSF